jgi:hypothetical protein
MILLLRLLIDQADLINIAIGRNTIKRKKGKEEEEALLHQSCTRVAL